MTMSKLLNWGFSCLEQTFQEVADICPNACALYKHGDLATRQAKILSTTDCANELQIDSLTSQSRLFLFRDYSFHTETNGLTCRVVLIPTAETSSSLTKVFLQGSLWRLTKGVAVVGATVLTSPVWALALVSTSRSCCTKKTSRLLLAAPLAFPPEPADSHVTENDIRRIGPAMIGYRHVSTEEHAQANAKHGFHDGCSLNLSFCGTSSPLETAMFQDLDMRIARGENCDDLIRGYERAITEFIRVCIYMDHDGPATTYGDLFATLGKTRFMLVRTSFLSAVDVSYDSYGGLGRFPKESVGPEKIILLPRIAREELGLDPALSQRRFSCAHEQETLVTYIASFYRQALLRYIRSGDFDPQTFEQLLTYERVIAQRRQNET